MIRGLFAERDLQFKAAFAALHHLNQKLYYQNVRRMVYV